MLWRWLGAKYVLECFLRRSRCFVQNFSLPYFSCLFSWISFVVVRHYVESARRFLRNKAKDSRFTCDEKTLGGEFLKSMLLERCYHWRFILKIIVNEYPSPIACYFPRNSYRHDLKIAFEIIAKGTLWKN